MTALHFDERTETQDPSGLANAEIDQLMAPVTVRIKRRARRIVWMFAAGSLALALVLIPVLSVGASESLDLTIFTVLFVGGPPALIARCWIMWNIKRARAILQRGKSLPAHIVENKIIRGRNRITFAWPSTIVPGRTADAKIEANITGELGPAKVIIYQYWLCLLVSGQAFIGHLWDFRRDL
jgi:hypothetical protein